eukprot:CAMPEP_0194300814 /NCGR_PEP_ID=MMETSP0169-20130528/61465_1 /TAXON_ID=218684 /ORGANISM="Corethron pennatum, Strain L29A3" /LENGTH=748 /DNA_ID=CAMNT_0039051023 /DNA_START=77 /DNA_END=2320 /DNA_ORIENTATION=+
MNLKLSDYLLAILALSTGYFIKNVDCLQPDPNPSRCVRGWRWIEDKTTDNVEILNTESSVYVASTKQAKHGKSAKGHRVLEEGGIKTIISPNEYKVCKVFITTASSISNKDTKGSKGTKGTKGAKQGDSGRKLKLIESKTGKGGEKAGKESKAGKETTSSGKKAGKETKQGKQTVIKKIPENHNGECAQNTCSSKKTITKQSSSTQTLITTKTHSERTKCKYWKRVPCEKPTGAPIEILVDKLPTPKPQSTQYPSIYPTEECHDVSSTMLIYKPNGRLIPLCEWVGKNTVDRCWLENSKITDPATVPKSFSGKYAWNLCGKTCGDGDCQRPPKCQDDTHCFLVWKPQGREVPLCQWAGHNVADRCKLETKSFIDPSTMPNYKATYVWEVCEKTCTNCQPLSPTSSPTDVPSFGPTEVCGGATCPTTICEDDENCFLVWKDNGKPLSLCDWVKRNKKDRCKLSTTDFVDPTTMPDYDAEYVWGICKKTCTNCDFPPETPFSTLPPTDTTTYVTNPPTTFCEDDENCFLVVKENGKPRSLCDWVKKNAKDRCKLSTTDFVDPTTMPDYDAEYVWGICKKTCTNCEETPLSTLPPTDTTTYVTNPPTTFCEDDENCFLVVKENGKPRSLCDWVKKNTKDRCKLSTTDFVDPTTMPDYDAEYVWGICKKTCTNCEFPSETPSTAPPTDTTTYVTYAPTTFCEGDDCEFQPEVTGVALPTYNPTYLPTTFECYDDDTCLPLDGGNNSITLCQW